MTRDQRSSGNTAVSGVGSLFNAFFLCALAFIFAAGAFPASARAQQAPAIIRDVEIESVLKEWSRPVIRAANLDPEAIRFILVQDDQINAFVAGGQNIFIYTGLLEKSKSPDEVVGVIAHELGHISGGHLVRIRSAYANASYEALLGMLLGIGAAVATGEGDLGAAISMGAQASALGRMMSFSQVQESSADQAALTALERAKISPQGLVDFMHTLENEELLPASQQTAYIRTHPLTRDRISALAAGLSRSAYPKSNTPASWGGEHARMLAKLGGFLSPEQVSWMYDDADRSLPAEYARSIAAYRLGDTQGALRHLDGLLATEPENPYFHELKGQILFESGAVGKAVPDYEKAVSLKPDAALIRVSYAHALIESAAGDRKRLDEAVRQLLKAEPDEGRSILLQRLLAISYGQLGESAMASLHLAEEALLKGQPSYAQRQAEAALKGLKPGTRAYLRANDILNFAGQEREEQEKNAERNSPGFTVRAPGAAGRMEGLPFPVSE